MPFDIGNIFDSFRGTVENSFDGVGSFFDTAESKIGSLFQGSEPIEKLPGGESSSPFSGKDLASAAIGAFKGTKSAAEAKKQFPVGLSYLDRDMRTIRAKGESTPTRAIQSVDAGELDRQWINTMRKLALLSREDTKVNLGDK